MWSRLPKPSLERLKNAPPVLQWEFFMSIAFIIQSITLVWVLYTENQQDKERELKAAEEQRIERIEDREASAERAILLKGQRDISLKYDALLIWLNSEGYNPPPEVLRGEYPRPGSDNDDSDEDSSDDDEGDGLTANGGSKSGSIAQPNPQAPNSNSNSNSDKNNSGGNGGGDGKDSGGNDKGDKGNNGKSDKADKSSSSSKDKPK